MPGLMIFKIRATYGKSSKTFIRLREGGKQERRVEILDRDITGQREGREINDRLNKGERRKLEWIKAVKRQIETGDR